MERSRWYGPTLVLLVSVLLVMVLGPGVARQLAFEHQQAKIEVVKNALAGDTSLAEMSNAFKNVARAVEPSVVHIQVYKKISNGVAGRRGIPEQLKRWFGPHGLPPELMPDNPEDNEEFGDEPAEKKNPKDMNRYEVPQQAGNGSGWVYTKDGYIITNHHVVEGADKIVVRFFDGEEREAVVKGTDPKTDVAVIKVEGGELHVATLAQTNVEQGEIVFAFGSPFGFKFSMSQGIVSAIGRTEVGILRSNQGYENFIQTDAAINPGNSGGPLTNLYGQVVGMNTAIATRTGAYNGLGFAIPVDMVKKVVDELITKGKIIRGYLGIYIDELDPKMAKSFGFEGKGVLVQSPIEGGPAAAAGLTRGDIITKVNGKAVSQPDELRNMVADIAPGTKVVLEVWHEGKLTEKELVIAAMPEQVAGASENEEETSAQTEKINREVLNKLGLENVVTLTKEAASRLNVKFIPGVLVMGVREGSAASAERLGRGMIITDVMGVKVKTVEDLVAELNKHDLKKGVRLSVKAGEVDRFVLLELPAD